MQERMHVSVKRTKGEEGKDDAIDFIAKRPKRSFGDSDSSCDWADALRPHVVAKSDSSDSSSSSSGIKKRRHE